MIGNDVVRQQQSVAAPALPGLGKQDAEQRRCLQVHHELPGVHGYLQCMQRVFSLIELSVPKDLLLH